MSLRLQSAMEYLMTYGWAILIIAVVMIALFELGVFGAQGGASTCIPQAGSLCAKMVFSANTLNAYQDPSITASVGEASQQWSNVYLIIVPQGQIISNTSMADESQPNDFYYWGQVYGQYYYVSSLSPGEVVNAQMYISEGYPWLKGAQITIGSRLTGAIWAMYSVQGSSTPLVSEIGTFTATAVSQ